MILELYSVIYCEDQYYLPLDIYHQFLTNVTND